VGDRVHVGRGVFSDVFMFTHRARDAVSAFVALETASGAALRLTHGHYLYVNGALAAAGTVAVGDAVELGGGAADVVARVSTVTSAGLYNPQTVQGDVVVDGVRASTYTTAVQPAFAHAVLGVARALWRLGGVSTDVLEDGGAGALLPTGGSVY
jgi:desert hedgehog